MNKQIIMAPTEYNALISPQTNILISNHISDEIKYLKEEIDQLKKRTLWLDYLESAGVDNWSGIDEAHRLYDLDHPEENEED